MRAFRNVRKVTMVDIPALTTSYVRMGFVDVKELEMENASLMENHEKLGELKRKQDEERERRRREEEERRRREEERKRKEEERRKKEEEERKRREEEERMRRELELKELRERREKGIVLNAEDLENLPVHVKSINVEKCEDYRKEVLDLSRFGELVELKIGEACFMYVNELKLIGLSELESVEIGKFSFSKVAFGKNPNRHFYLKNCPKLKSLKMGRYSFSDYTVIEIENVGALEEIEIGDLHEGSYNFYSASLNLKSMVVATQSPLDLPQLKRLIFGDGSFGSCHHLVFESNTISVSSSNRPARTAIHPNGSQCVSILPLQTRVLCYSAKFFPLTRITE